MQLSWKLRIGISCFQRIYVGVNNSNNGITVNAFHRAAKQCLDVFFVLASDELLRCTLINTKLLFLTINLLLRNTKLCAYSKFLRP